LIGIFAFLKISMGISGGEVLSFGKNG